jgi:hypothetical protein
MNKEELEKKLMKIFLNSSYTGVGNNHFYFNLDLLSKIQNRILKIKRIYE